MSVPRYLSDWNVRIIFFQGLKFTACGFLGVINFLVELSFIYRKNLLMGIRLITL